MCKELDLAVQDSNKSILLDAFIQLNEQAFVDELKLDMECYNTPELNGLINGIGVELNINGVDCQIHCAVDMELHPNGDNLFDNNGELSSDIQINGTVKNVTYEFKTFFIGYMEIEISERMNKYLNLLLS